MTVFLIPIFIAFLNPKILGLLFLRKIAKPGEWSVKNKTSENRREFFRKASIIVHEWSSHLEMLSLPQVIENFKQYLLLRTDILEKTVVGCPWHHFQKRMNTTHPCNISEYLNHTKPWQQLRRQDVSGMEWWFSPTTIQLWHLCTPHTIGE